MNLIIVESPTKANTFNRFLKGDKYHVEATMGHIRDLPESKIGLDLDHDFKPEYKIAKKKADIVNKIKALAKKSETIILATDSDREGEAISYHIGYLLGFIKEDWPVSRVVADGKLKRIVFHEITQEALSEALAAPQKLNLDLVNAQQARRILDRIVGYKLSPLLWKKMGKRWLSAGRVQTVALRFIVEREKEIAQFKKEPFYKIFALFNPEIKAELTAKGEERFEKSFSLDLFDGKYTYTKTTITSANLEGIKKDLETDFFKVADVSENQTKRYPPPPFTTSSLQQDASRLFGWPAKSTMRLAQDLYERGLITYHRTDSVSLSAKFLAAAQKFILKEYSDQYTLSVPRVYKTKSKLAQEAHEAIRPTKLDQISTPIKKSLSGSKIKDQKSLPSHRHEKLYELIFRRAVASQMKEAEIKIVKIKILSGKQYLFETSWEQVVFDGFLKLKQAATKKNDEVNKINLRTGDKLTLKSLDCKETETTPPPRYNEASLIKTLEERGIGRPSTYAPTISVIQDRSYVEKKENRFYPTMVGTTVADYLSAAFQEIFKIDFTADLEQDLDLIASSEKNMITVLNHFYEPFIKLLEREEENKEHINIEEKSDEKCPVCGHDLLFRYSRFGKFYACADFPKCKFTKAWYQTLQQPCPKCGGLIVVRQTKKKKKFYGCANYPKCDFAVWRLNQIKSSKRDK